METTIKPKAPIRRFDIFAEWNRIKGIKELKLDPEDAKAYGLAVAEVVAARKFYGHRTKYRGATREYIKKHEGTPWWRKMASPAEFDEKIVERMGKEFYEKVFSKKIEEAYREGKDYMDIRDSLRKEWNELLKG
ncbi:hypothetical protein [Desulfurobacterium sp.]|uniref:hypothetical protein n=1 Tax=Desulfurobacterium sp. TaxID=2004706 RepID=UPI00263992EB|nr:hypothetical protein [Desulfurobacterium sp.]